jgi:hypothetical protein
MMGLETDKIDASYEKVNFFPSHMGFGYHGDNKKLA